MIPFPKDFKDFLKLLEKHRVRYLVVGGYALALHGYVRVTGDMDIFIEVSRDNADRIFKTFNDFGFRDPVLRELFRTPGKMVRIGRPPLRIEILTEISGVTFEDAYPEAEFLVDGNDRVAYIGYEKLIQNKRSTSRPKDKSDSDALEKGKGQDI